MALPKILDENGNLIPKPLEFDADVNKLTVGEMRLMRGHIHFDADNTDSIANAFVIAAELFIHHTNWTEDEVNQLTIEELGEVIQQLRVKERESAVPLVKSVSSNNGQEETKEIPRNGQTISPMPSSLDVTHKMSDIL